MAIGAVTTVTGRSCDRPVRGGEARATADDAGCGAAR